MSSIPRFETIEVRRAVAAGRGGVPWEPEAPVLAAGVECVSLRDPARSLSVAARAFREIESANLALECLWQMLYG